MKIVYFKLLFLLPLLMVAAESYATGVPLNLADSPLAVETEGVAPNIMLIIDDSGSMACGYGRNQCGDDVFYAPGFDANKEYRCSNASSVLSAVDGKELVVHVSKETAAGVPYFKYNNKFYTWGDNVYSNLDGNEIDARVCFDPDENFEVKLHAYKERGVVGTRCAVSDRRGNCTRTENYIATPQYLTAEDADTRTFDGNFLNWYFSDTIAEWADDSVDGGFKKYIGSSLDHDYWTEKAAKNFITTNLNFATAPSYTSRVRPASTVIDNSTKNANNKAWFPNLVEATNRTDATDATYGIANAWGNGTHYAMDTGNSVQHRHGTDWKYSMAGMKPGVSFYHMRMTVAIDVGKKVIRDIDKAHIAVSNFWGQLNTSGKITNSGNSKNLIHGFVELDSEKNPTKTKANKESLIKAIGALTAYNGTPTAATLAAAARYMFTGWLDEEFDYKPTASAAVQKVKVGDLMSLQFTNNASFPINTSEYPEGKFITEANWCQKNAIAVLTDGVPSSDQNPSLLDSSSRPSRSQYVPRGAPLPSSNAHIPLTKVAGALFDHDFLPNMPNRPDHVVHNIETFMIAMGADAVVENPAFENVGKAGGGGAENFYKASDGGAIAQAFNDIMDRVLAQSASVTAIAVSSVAEVRDDNYAVQATYDTSHWSSQLKAYKFNSEGRFINPGDSSDDEGYISSAEVEPAWEANSILNDTYIIGNATKHALVKTRKVYTWNDDTAKGMRFGANNLSTSNANQYFNALPASWKNDLGSRAEATAQARYDLMMYLLGDITNEEGFATKGKYRQRGTYALSGGSVTSVTKGGFLGDIVDSSPVYVKAPPRPWDDKNYGTVGKRYSAFVEAFTNRQAVVYAGTNRGYLHAFAVDGPNAGKELFAYMPTALTSAMAKKGYHYLANRNYEHRFYVDLTPTVSDVFVDFYNESNFDPEWRTVLLGGLRAGGKGIFALDITCPTALEGTNCEEAFNEKNVLWEFTDEDDGDLGYTYGEPIIAKVNYNYANIEEGKMPRNGNGKGRWAAIVSNGYNSNSGKAALFIIFLDGPSSADGWKLGRDYLKLVVDESAGESELKNGLSSATAIDVDGDGIVDYIYAGDLKGKMWSFNVSQTVIAGE